MVFTQKLHSQTQKTSTYNLAILAQVPPKENDRLLVENLKRRLTVVFCET
jgi:hypothetical protein